MRKIGLLLALFCGVWLFSACTSVTIVQAPPAEPATYQLTMTLYVATPTLKDAQTVGGILNTLTVDRSKEICIAALRSDDFCSRIAQQSGTFDSAKTIASMISVSEYPQDTPMLEVIVTGQTENDVSSVGETIVRELPLYLQESGHDIEVRIIEQVVCEIDSHVN